MRLFAFILELTSFACLVYANPFGLGTSLRLGAARSSTAISKVTTTLNAGTPPVQLNGEIVLYPALSNGTGDFLYSSLEAWPIQFCGETESQWCIRTAVFSNRKQYIGEFAPANASEPVTFTFERFSNKSGWTISASINENVVSSLSYPSGPMTLFGLTYECVDDCDPAISNQTYTNTVIELEEANASWGDSLILGSKIYGDGTLQPGTTGTTVISGINSSQNGQVWSIDSITIPVSL